MEILNSYGKIEYSRMEDSVSSRIKFAVLFFAILLLPIYTFGSGGVQPPHFLFLIFFISIIASGSTILPKWIICFLLLVLYVSVVEGFYAFTTGNSRGMVHGLYYSFNFLVVLSVYGFLTSDRLANLKWALVGATGIALLGVLTISSGTVVSGGAGRAVGTFNNPNQLGYFSVCIGSIFFLLFRAGYLHYLSCMLLVGAATLLAIFSLSKAAMIALSFMLAFQAAPKKLTVKSFIFSAVFLGIVGLSISYLLVGGYLDEFRFYNRLANMQNESDSSLEVRGYLAFLQGSDMQIIFGLGDNTTKSILGYEVHSTFMNVMTNYGVIGLVLLLMFLSNWVIAIWRSFGFSAVCGVCGPSMLYGITHNGMRFTAFWILIALSFSLAYSCRKNVNYR